MVKLRVTSRCLRDDLGLDPSHVSREAQHYCHAHPALTVFVNKRGAAPTEGENVLHVTPYGHVKSLHVGRARGATIYDAETDVCWLLAFGETHAIGERRDVFNHFEWLSGRDELLPSESDYESVFTVTSASLVDALSEVGADLYLQAKDASGAEVGTTLTLSDGQDAKVSIAIEMVVEETATAEQGWIAFTVPLGAPFGVEQAYDVATALLPDDIDADDVELTDSIAGRTIHYTELALTWSRYS